MTTETKKLNADLRRRIVEAVYKAKDGHIPSAFSIVDIIAFLYEEILKYDPSNPAWPERDYFILSKGHGCAALYAVLEKIGFITKKDVYAKSQYGGILGGHPDRTKVPGVEASTGSLGHGIVSALGIALGLKIRQRRNKVIAIAGDGESNEGTVWEAALVAANLKLGSLCLIIDNNGSADQILPVSSLRKKWEAFNWEVFEINGHEPAEMRDVFQKIDFDFNKVPKVIIAHTVKGKGVPFLEGHGTWHSKVPNEQELESIYKELGV